MKGILHKTEQGWVVRYFDTEKAYDVMYCEESLPLHPDDVKQINADAQVFDNIEARIAAYPEVEFEIKYYWDGRMEQPIDVAKLIDATKEQTNGERFEEFMRTVEGYPELEGTINLCNDITKKRTGKMTEEEWVAVERGEISDKDIFNVAFDKYVIEDEIEAFTKGAEWYREQLRIRNEKK
jgi:hypothetical protein